MAKVFSSAVQTIVTTPNQPQFRVEVINVPLSGTPIQLPDIIVPDGVDIVIKSKSSNGGKRIYVSNSSLNCGNALKRMELRSGESIGLCLDNVNLIWIDSNANNASVEIIVEA